MVDNFSVVVGPLLGFRTMMSVLKFPVNTTQIIETYKVD